MRSSFSGSAPVFRSFARSWAVVIVKPPEICEPVRPSMPSGFWRKSMYGVEISSSSSTIAKCWLASAGSGARMPTERLPRSAISRVTSCQILRPLSVNSNVTFGCVRVLVGLLLGVLDLRAAQRDVVLQDEPVVGLLLDVGVLLGADDDRVRLDLVDLGLVAQRLRNHRERLGPRVQAVALGGPGALAVDGLGLLVDGVEGAPVARVVRFDLRRALDRPLERVVERDRADRPAAWPPVSCGFSGSGLPSAPMTLTSQS